MKKMVFKYKSGACKLVCISNILIPICILFCGINQENDFIEGMSSTAFQSFTVGQIFSATMTLVFILIGLFYTFKVFQNNGTLKFYFADQKKKYKYQSLLEGLFLHAFTSFSCLLIVTNSFFFNSESWFKYLTYGFTPLTLITGLISNMCIQLFESRNYFQVYFYRHKEDDVKEVLTGILRSKNSKS